MGLQSSVVRITGDDLDLNHQRYRVLALFILLLFAVGCSQANETPDADPTDPATAAIVASTATVSPEPLPTPTQTPEPTPIPAGVTISDQPLDESGTLVAEVVTLPEPGWLVIYRTVDGKAEDVIGRQPLAAGVHEQVVVTVEAQAATDDLMAGVHKDLGAEGVFEFPGEDEPYPGEPEAAFAVELLLPMPQVEVADQSVVEDGVVTLTSMEILEPTWVAIHTDIEGEIGPVIGSRLFEAGTYENETLTIDWRRATPRLHVVLHQDEATAGVFDYPDEDMPILMRGEPVVASFEATYPPELLVYDQPIIDGTVTIERAISDGPGYVAIYNEAEGQPGFIIGTEALEDGLNERVTVTLLQSAITTQLFARLHQDTEPGDAFNFPGQDPPVLYNNRLPNAAGFRTDSGPHVYVADQRLGDDDTVVVATVISPVAAWAAVYDDAEGQPGDLLGQTWLPAGVNRDVLVELEGAEPGTFHLVLYQDLGAAEEFEVPGADTELRSNDNRPVRIPFVLIPPADR